MCLDPEQIVRVPPTPLQLLPSYSCYNLSLVIGVIIYFKSVDMYWCCFKLLRMLSVHRDTDKHSCSVQFCSRVYLFAWNWPYAFHPLSRRFPQCCPRNSSNVHLIDDGSLSSFQGRSSSASSFHASLFQAIDGVLSLVLYPQVLSQVPQHFRSSETQATYEGCFARQSIISNFYFCFSKLFESVRMMTCVVIQTVTSWCNPAEGIGDYSNLHCQVGGWDRIVCTVFMDGSRTLLDRDEAPPWLVFGDRDVSVHYDILLLIV